AQLPLLEIRPELVDHFQRTTSPVIDSGEVDQHVVAVRLSITQPPQQLAHPLRRDVDYVLVAREYRVVQHRFAELHAQRGHARVRGCVRRLTSRRTRIRRCRLTRLQAAQGLIEALVRHRYGRRSAGLATAVVDTRPLTLFWFVELP